jgi:hypothetical protein
VAWVIVVAFIGGFAPGILSAGLRASVALLGLCLGY